MSFPTPEELNTRQRRDAQADVERLTEIVTQAFATYRPDNRYTASYPNGISQIAFETVRKELLTKGWLMNEESDYRESWLVIVPAAESGH